MEDLEVFLRVLLAICGGIVTIAAVIKVVWGVIEKALGTQAAIAKNAEEIAELKRATEEQARRQRDDNRVLLLCVSQMMEHMITGNDVDALKDKREMLQEHLLDNVA